MNTNRLGIAVLIASAFLFFAQDALAFYKPQTGCWPNRDPLGEQGGQNLYAFVSNDPLSSRDLWGLRVFTVGITAKSWINQPITAGTVAGGNSVALWLAVKLVGWLTHDSVVDDSINGKYRFLSSEAITVDCCHSIVMSAHFSTLFTDVGLEGGFMIPPDAIVVGNSGTSTSSEVDFTWKVKARPRPEAELAVFTPVRYRFGHVYIWHEINGSIKCNHGKPLITLQLLSSQFPSAAVYFRVDATLFPRAAFHAQGPMAQLWDPDPVDPTLVQ